MGWFIKLYTWSGGCQIYLFKVFHLGLMFDGDEFGSYFQITFGIWRATITIQIGNTDYEKW
tara:strand:+ start:305 stop:487 length:183 start_codon:yes stop_codon:yes gene_type:complete